MKSTNTMNFFQLIFTDPDTSTHLYSKVYFAKKKLLLDSPNNYGKEPGSEKLPTCSCLREGAGGTIKGSLEITIMSHHCGIMGFKGCVP